METNFLASFRITTQSKVIAKCVELIWRNFKTQLIYKSKYEQKDMLVMFLDGMVKYFKDINSSQVNFYP